jgi:hypothetical protein
MCLLRAKNVGFTSKKEAEKSADISNRDFAKAKHCAKRKQGNSESAIFPTPEKLSFNELASSVD